MISVATIQIYLCSTTSAIDNMTINRHKCDLIKLVMKQAVDQIWLLMHRLLIPVLKYKLEYILPIAFFFFLIHRFYFIFN